MEYKQGRDGNAELEYQIIHIAYSIKALIIRSHLLIHLVYYSLARNCDSVTRATLFKLCFLARNSNY